MLFRNQESFYISNIEGLEEVLSAIKEAKIFALDTEFTRQTTYYPILSLIQIAVINSKKEKSLYINDCLCGLDLQGFYEVIADENIIKILHSSSQDLQIFFYKSNLVPAKIFDTQVMANFCGLDYGCGYSNLVKLFFDQILAKDQQRSDWQIRPLLKEQIDYALLDVFFLHEIYEKLLCEIEAKSRFDWFEEEMSQFISNSIYKSDESLFKKFSFRKKNSAQIAMIKKLILLREEWAKELDVPRQRIIKDENIEEIIFSKKISAKINKKIIPQIEEILLQNNALDLDSVQNKIKSIDSGQKEIYNKAREKVREIARELGLKEQFLISNSDIKKVVKDKERIKSNWRYNIIGKALEQITI